MPDYRRVDEPHQGVSEQQRQVMPGVVPGPEQLEPVCRAPVDTHRRVALWLWWDVYLRELQAWNLVGVLQGMCFVSRLCSCLS